MQTIRALYATALQAAWTRALVPSIVLAAVVTLDQMSRGPSITGMIVTQLLG